MPRCTFSKMTLCFVTQHSAVFGQLDMVNVGSHRLGYTQGCISEHLSIIYLQLFATMSPMKVSRLRFLRRRCVL